MASPGGDASGSDPVPVAIMPKRNVESKMIEVAGTFFIPAHAQTNRWFRFPWEFQSFIRNSTTKALANEYQYQYSLN